MHRYERAFAELAASAAGLAAEEVAPLVKTAEPGRGDFALPCFPFASRLRRSPVAIASDVAASIPADPRFASIEAAGPYVNAAVDPARLVEELVPEIRRLGERFARSDAGAGRRVVVEFSSPNIAKPLGFHHLRSTMIGSALCRIHRALGYEVAALDFIGDWGKTFGLLAEAFGRFGDRARLEAEGIRYLLEIYVEANRALEEDPSFDEAARAMFRRQEEGDPEAIFGAPKSAHLKRFIRSVS